MTEPQRDALDEDAVFWGAIIGFFVGAITWFFQVPQRGEKFRDQLFGEGKQLRERIGAPDPVAQSMAEGKSIARQQRGALSSEAKNGNHDGVNDEKK